MSNEFSCETCPRYPTDKNSKNTQQFTSNIVYVRKRENYFCKVSYSKVINHNVLLLSQELLQNKHA